MDPLNVPRSPLASRSLAFELKLRTVSQYSRIPDGVPFSGGLSFEPILDFLHLSFGKERSACASYIAVRISIGSEISHRLKHEYAIIRIKLGIRLRKAWRRSEKV